MNIGDRQNIIKYNNEIKNRLFFVVIFLVVSENNKINVAREERT